MKLILPNAPPPGSHDPLSELEACLRNPDVEVSTPARDQALEQLAVLENRLRRVSAKGVCPADYPTVKALLDACQSAREVLTIKGSSP